MQLCLYDDLVLVEPFFAIVELLLHVLFELEILRLENIHLLNHVLDLFLAKLHYLRAHLHLLDKQVDLLALVLHLE